MSKKASATFTDDDYEAALLVAEYQDRTIASYIVHCVNMETKKRIGAILHNGASPHVGKDATG